MKPIARMRATPRTVPTIIAVVLAEKLLSGDDGDDEVARGSLGEDNEVVADEELAVIEDFVAENAVVVLVAVDGLEDTISPFSKKTPFPSSQHPCPMVPFPQQ